MRRDCSHRPKPPQIVLSLLYRRPRAVSSSRAIFQPYLQPLHPSLELLLNRGLSGVKVMRFSRCAVAVALILATLAINSPFQVSAQSNTSNTFTIQGWQNSPYLCWYWWASFNLIGGEEAGVQWSTSSQIPTAVDLYIATPSAAGRRWFCDPGPEALYYDFGAFGSMHWVAPSTGTYALLVVNDAPYTVSGTISLVANNTTIPFSATGYGSARQPICPLFFPYPTEC